MMSKYEYKKEERKDERLNISIIFVDDLRLYRYPLRNAFKQNLNSTKPAVKEL